MILQILIVLIIIYFLMILYRDLYIFPKIIKICKDKQKYLKLILPIIVNKLNEYNITYFILGGTLLGYKRHNKKIIPWDDDIDLCIIYTDDLDEKIQLIKEDIKDEFIIENIFFGYQVINKFNKTFIDLFVYHEEGNKFKPKSIISGTLKSNLFKKFCTNKNGYSSEINLSS